ncbi:recombinase family protein [Fictibacillus sp. KU28468]|uniref:recombinase family protein n=1 Tax=Fictibacillus sp. KU28468 TaxID=2991053 RepID=UPI00223D70F4|nr:recombinase family protein [Fictibacillus sp. KU28468]UZJ79442.1 recombinase family protein [Fictibacillus sp. KU28468]
METVKEIAIYLRKSRDESDGKEDVLAKHESLLLEYAKKRDLKFKVYKEIGSSEFIDSRPQMIQLLKDVEQDLYDAVLVVDLDRLSRGDFEEMGRIKRIFRTSNTLVLTPNKAYDFNNEDESVMTDIEMVFANHEYRMIKKRMMRGKKQGAKAGKWTNGTPPYPYIYNRITKELEVDEEKSKVYNLMKSLFLDKMMPPHEIAWELNKLGFKTNRNADWHENSVRRILISEIHLGLITYGKTTGNGHKSKPKSEWIFSEGTHEKLKTDEEHQKILNILEARKIMPKGSRTNVQVLSKILFCGKCKSTLAFTVSPTGRVFVKPCGRADRLGNRCKNRGVSAEVIFAQLMFDLKVFQSQLLSKEPKKQSTDNSSLNLALSLKHEELERLENGNDRIRDLYIEGLLDKNEMKLKSEKLLIQIQAKREEIRLINQSLADVENTKTNEERVVLINEFKKAWDTKGISNKELNKLAKEIIDRIEMSRDGNYIKINIKFL